jgi:hypothetical protein
MVIDLSLVKPSRETIQKTTESSPKDGIPWNGFWLYSFSVAMYLVGSNLFKGIYWYSVRSRLSLI